MYIVNNRDADRDRSLSGRNRDSIYSGLIVTTLRGEASRRLGFALCLPTSVRSEIIHSGGCRRVAGTSNSCRSTGTRFTHRVTTCTKGNTGRADHTISGVPIEFDVTHVPTGTAIVVSVNGNPIDRSRGRRERD